MHTFYTVVRPIVGLLHVVRFLLHVRISNVQVDNGFTVRDCSTVFPAGSPNLSKRNKVARNRLGCEGDEKMLVEVRSYCTGIRHRLMRRI